MAVGQGRIAQASIEQVLQRSDLHDLASGFSQMRKQGSEFLGRCPFHDERTPSFWVNPDKGVYHCFGCGASGDTITFVQEKQGLDFVEAIEYLADRYRVQLEYDGDAPGKKRLNRKRLYELMDATASFYEAYLWQAKGAEPVREYLRGRGIDEDTARAFRMGCSPEARDSLTRKAQAKGFTREELGEARLITSRGTDFFRGRLMVPIIDRAGRVTAFGARKLREEQFGGKYVNSADGPLFHKRQTVFLAPGIRDAATKDGRVIVVEGYMDVIAMWQSGFRNVCAVMGANLSKEQVLELKRLAPRAVFAFDPDPAGQMATVGALDLARQHELDVRVALLPMGEDPADILGSPDGTDRMRDLLDHGLSFLRYRVSTLLGSGNLSDPGDRDRIWREGVELFRAVPDSPERRDELARFADRLGLDIHASVELQQQLGTSLPAAASNRPGAAGPVRRPSRTGSSGAPMSPAATTAALIEQRFLALAMTLAERKEVNLGHSQVESSFFLLDVHRRAWEALRSESENPLDVSRIRSDSELVGLVAEIGALAQREFAHRAADLHELLDEYGIRLQERWLERSIAALKERIRDADAEDPELVAELGQLLVRQRNLNPRLRDTQDQE